MIGFQDFSTSLRIFRDFGNADKALRKPSEILHWKVIFCFGRILKQKINDDSDGFKHFNFLKYIYFLNLERIIAKSGTCYLIAINSRVIRFALFDDINWKWRSRLPFITSE